VFTPPWFLARKELGDAFSARPDARKLVTSGIYSKIRHPVYVFGTPAWVGALLPMLGWQAFVVGLIIVAVEIVRARREERLMAHLRARIRGLPKQHLVLRSRPRSRRRRRPNRQQPAAPSLRLLVDLPGGAAIMRCV
jgi:hypothetical protein